MKENLFSLKQILFIIISIFALNISSAQINFSQNFDSSTSLPTGWAGAYTNTSSNTCSGTGRTPRGSLNSGTNSLTSPIQTNASNGSAIHVSFNYKVLNISGLTGAATNFGTIEVQYSINGTTYTTFHTINSSNHTVSTNCAPVSLTIPAGTIPSGSSFQLKFLGTHANGNLYIYIDDVVVTQNTGTPPNCNAVMTSPVNGAVNVPITTNTITWSAATGIPTGYRLRVGTTPGGSNVINNVDVGTATSSSISLGYSTTYYVGITPYNANGDATGCTEYSFTTAAPITTTVPWKEEFLTNLLPTGWSRTTGVIIGLSNRLPASEGNIIYRNLNSTNITSNFSTISVGEIQSGDELSFTYRIGQNLSPYAPPAAGSGNFIVSVSTDYGLNYTNVQTVSNNGVAGWQNYSFDLSSYVGQHVKIRLTLNRNSDDYFIGFDNFYIGQPVTCEAPEDLILNFVGDDTAQISWDSTMNAVDYDWFVFSSGANPSTAAPIKTGTVSTSSVNITGLASSTDYDFYVKRNCGTTDGTSIYSELLSFTTQCETINNFPFTETFENNSTSKDCWTMEYVSGTTNWSISSGTPEGSVTSAYNGSLNALFFMASYAPNKTKLVSPSFAILNMNEPKLTFWYANEQGPDPSEQNELNIYYKTSTGGSWTLIPTATYTSDVDTWTYVELDLPQASDDYYIAFEGTNRFGEGIVIDDVTISDFDACLSTIWDGFAWSNGTPDLSKKAIIDGSLILTSNLEACELEVTSNGSLEIPAGFSFTVNGIITNTALAENFLVASGGNLIQNKNVSNTGSITVMRDSNPMRRLEYTLWSSPVIGQNLFGFSPETVNGVTNYPGSTGRIYVYNGATDTYVNPNPYTAETVMNATIGYLFRAPNNYHATNRVVYEGTFIGVPNNGDLSTSVYANGYSSVGNPYPSNIDADAFLNANPQVSAIYFWNNNHSTGNNYSSCVYGNCVAAAGGGVTPNGIISTGQGFLVETTGSSVNFNNFMRVDNTAIFSKGKNQIDNNRFWLNLNDEFGEGYNQMLVSYMTGATNEIDHQMDGKIFGYQGSALYSIINEENFIIQSRSLPFQNSDVVKLGFKAAEAGKFNISLPNFDGLFTEGDVTIYLIDNQTNTFHNLMESAYTFESEAGEFNTRFEIVYEEDEVMGTGDLTASSVQIYKHNQNIVVESKNEKILSVELFDLSGRNIFRNEKVNANHYEFTSLSKGVLIVRVQTQNGEVVTKRVINK